MENSHRDYSPEDTDGLLFVKLSARMFSPLFSCTVFSPSRRRAWRLQTEPFDYRAAQHSGALVPRGGEWYSRSWINLFGDLSLILPTPPDTDIPDPITCRARLSWWPAHATFTWLDGSRGFQKISARPEEDTASEWIPVAYDEDVFTDEIRARYPRAFTEPTPVPLRPVDTAASTAPSASTPQESPPITVTEAKPTEQEDSRSSSVTEDDYNYEWWNHGWYGHSWSKGEEGNNNNWSGDHGDWNAVTEHEWKTSWADTPPDTPRKPKENPSPKTVNPEPNVTNPPTPLIPTETQPSAISVSSPNAPDSGTDSVRNSSFRVEQVTVQTRTQSVEVTRPNESQTMIALQRLALTGPPSSREDRLARQSLASRLTLSTELYNLLVFGEDDEGHLPEQIEDGPPTCAAPPGTARLPSP